MDKWYIPVNKNLCTLKLATCEGGSCLFLKRICCKIGKEGKVYEKKSEWAITGSINGLDVDLSRSDGDNATRIDEIIGIPSEAKAITTDVAIR